MIVWGIVAGAMLGLFLAGFDDDGIWPGAVLGGAMAFWLRIVIRREIARGHARLRAELALVGDTPPPAATVSVPATADPKPPATWAEKFAAIAPEEASAAPDAAEAPAGISVAASLSAGTTPPAEPLPPPPPRRPTIVERLIAAGTGWLFGGNTIVRVGLVILFVGLSFLAHYAADAGLFPIELRLALVAAAGIALLGVGFARRTEKPEFALTLQGGGVAVLYLTMFAGSRLFDVIPGPAAFVLMIIVCALGCALALLQNSQTLAATSFAGGFAVPILLAGAGGPLGLFGYYTVLNLAVLGIAHRRSWRIVNLIGFVSTFGLATLWGLLVYDPALYAISQFFLILFVLIYVAAAILHARNTPTRLGNAVDSSLLFGPALVGFGLQVGLVRDMPLGSAFSALGFGALYLVLALFVMRRGRGDNRLLLDCLIAIAVGFVTLAVPLALGVRWTATVWALEGAGAFWVGMRQARWLPRAFGLLLQAAGGLVFVGGIRDTVSAWPLLNPNVLGAVLIALPAFAIAWWLRRPLAPGESRIAKGYGEIERMLPKPMFLYGFLFAWLACLLEIVRTLPPGVAGGAAVPVFDAPSRGLLAMLAFVLLAALSAFVGRRLVWGVATWPGRVTLVALALALLGRSGAGSFVLYTPNWIIWAVALAVHYRLLWRNDRSAGPETMPLQRATHVGSAWVVAGLFTDCLWFAIDRAGLWQTSWAGVVLLVGTIAALLVLTLWAGGTRRRGWPLDAHAPDYFWFAALPIAGLAFVGALGTALFAAGRTDPLPYVPLLNPVDLSIALAIAALVLWRRTVLAADPPPAGAEALAGPPAPIALAALGFVWLNTVWLRIAHHLLGIDWTGPALLGSFTVQTGLSILWTLLALGLTLTAHRRGIRALWLAGAGLLGVVVAKLLLVDLSNADGAARIVTFIVVGILMLVVGYFAPLPPRADARGEAVR